MQKKIRTRRKTWKDRRDREQSTSFTETPLKKAIPLGLQHVLAMFVGNLTPILIISGACGIAGEEFGSLQVDLLQNAMLIAGIVTLIQLFAIGPVGGKVPIIMGTSSGFIGVFNSVVQVMGEESLHMEPLCVHPSLVVCLRESLDFC